MTGDLDGKVALVTGSSSGIGEATARHLAAAGAAVMVNSRRSEEAGRAVAATLPNADYRQGDVAVAGDAQALVAATVERFGRLDILVNNAGTTVVIPHHDLDGASVDVWRGIFEVNVFGTWQVTVAAVPHLRASGDGVVVNMSSVAGHRPTGSSIPYACSKAALSHMTRLLANVLGPEVRVNGVAPGLVDTPWTAEWHEVRAGVESLAPLRRAGAPDDVASVVTALVRARYTTGEVVLVDGGINLR